MPVSRNDFDRGRTEPTNTEQVLTYLQNHPDHAYTAAEISTAIKKNPADAAPKGTGTKAKLESAWHVAGKGVSASGFRISLDLLVAQRKLSAKRVKANGKTAIYYTVRKGSKARN